MASMIESIHGQVVEPDQELSALLNRSLLAATVLRESSVCAWIRAERDGYGEGAEIPAYRRGDDAALLAWRPGLGWVEAPITDAQRKAVSDYSLPTGITELEADYEAILRKGGCPSPLDPARANQIRRLTSLDTDLCQMVPMSGVDRVLQTVRMGIRLWSGALLEAGVRGQGSSFSSGDRAAAAGVAERLEEILQQAGEAADAAVAEMRRRQGGLLSRLLGRAPA
ncbi:MAG: hypothetical protein JJT90_13155 [Ectothiorhodospiraceae bacterium]|nr:hypothetical protein [Ectothiorhodospiraceae bacterium]